MESVIDEILAALTDYQCEVLARRFGLKLHGETTTEKCREFLMRCIETEMEAANDPNVY